jgi:hypothetical protein
LRKAFLVENDFMNEFVILGASAHEIKLPR